MMNEVNDKWVLSSSPELPYWITEVSDKLEQAIIAHLGEGD
jgi:hypothetical protein